MKKLAQIDFGTFEGFGPLGKPQGTGILNLTSFLSTLIGVLTIIAFIWFTIQFILGAISIITAGGDKQALEGARKKITNAIIGVVVVIAAVFVIDLVGTIFGIPFLDLYGLFNTLITPTGP